MTLAENLLPRLSDWKPAGAGRHSWAESFPGWTVRVSADKVDSLSCLVWELTLARTGDAAPADRGACPQVGRLSTDGLTLQGWAAAVAARVTGLMEPLKLYEVDTTRDEAVLRSEAPARKGERLAYYEVRLHGLARAVVRRFAATKDAPGREQVAFVLTHEALAKLAGDIAG